MFGNITPITQILRCSILDLKIPKIIGIYNSIWIYQWPKVDNKLKQKYEFKLSYFQ